MRELQLLRNLYQPFHPVRTERNRFVSYNEFIPDRRLRPFIFHYWEMKTSGPCEGSFLHKVIPNGCVDVYFNVTRPDESFITGLSDKHSSVNVPAECRYIGICFAPTVAPQLYRFNGIELHNRHERLEDLALSTASFIKSALTPDLSSHQVKSLLDKHFQTELSKADFKCDRRLLSALHNIFTSNGNVRIESDLDVGLSPRQLRRVFDTYIGDSPKSFSRTVRFQRYLQANLSSHRADNQFYDFGYYDQVHFIKEFKRLYGTTPSHVTSYQ